MVPDEPSLKPSGTVPGPVPGPGSGPTKAITCRLCGSFMEAWPSHRRPYRISYRCKRVSCRWERYVVLEKLT